MPGPAVAWLVVFGLIYLAIPSRSQANVLWHLRAWVAVIGVIVVALAWHGANLQGVA